MTFWQPASSFFPRFFLVRQFLQIFGVVSGVNVPNIIKKFNFIIRENLKSKIFRDWDWRITIFFVTMKKFGINRTMCPSLIPTIK